MKTNISYISIIVFHAVLGFLIYLNESLSKAYFFGIVFYFSYRIIISSDKNRVFEILKACGYVVGAEVFLRTTRGAISYEAGKYLVIVFVIMGIFYKGVSGKGYPYFLYLMLLIPSIFVASTTLSFDANFRTNIAFVLSGPACLGFASLFSYKRRISTNQLSVILLFVLLPIITHTSYIYFYVPELKDVLRNAASNRAAAGGFGANQVSGILGLGMFISATRLFLKSPTISLKILNVLIFGFIFFRAVTTLSRGGVLTAIASILVFVFFYYIKSSGRKKRQVISVLLILLIGLVSTWMIGEAKSGGLTGLRYANKDHFGREKASLTTGRVELFEGELEGFVSSPFFGIGSSRAKDQRIEVSGQGTTSHSEFSRTLAEHGSLGVIILLILIFKPFDVLVYNTNNYFFYSFLVFWFLTINHMSMRIAMPAFIYALALLHVTNNERKHPLRRKLSQGAAA